MAQANSPSKAAETDPTHSSTTSSTIAKASEQKETISTPKEKWKGEKEDKQKHSKEQPVSISSDEESDSELVIDEKRKILKSMQGRDQQHRQPVRTRVWLRWRLVPHSQRKSSNRSMRQKKETERR